MLFATTTDVGDPIGKFLARNVITLPDMPVISDVSFSAFNSNATYNSISLRPSSTIKYNTTSTLDLCDNIIYYKPNNVYYADSIYQGAIPSNPKLVSSGFVCCTTEKCGCNVTCNWTIAKEPIYLPQGSPTATAYLNFITLYGSGINKVVVSDASACPQKTVAVPNITDPYTGEVGIGCKLTQELIDDSSSYGDLYNYYQFKARNFNGVDIVFGKFKIGLTIK
jgi:hypothetical protein